MIYNFHKSNFRQAKNPPRSDNASKHRTKEDDVSLKRIRVNAQVTFMISVLEMIGGIINLTLVLMFKTTTFPVVINSMIIYLIILPRAFLMNTSHNKNRIIEHGWRNVLRNTFGLLPKPSHVDCSPGKKMNENKTSNTIHKRRDAGWRYKRGQVHPHLSHDLGKSLPTGSTLILKTAFKDDLPDDHIHQRNKRLEIMMRPEKLELTCQMDQPIVSLITNRGNNVLDSKQNRRPKRSCSTNNQVVLTDLEQHSEDVFGCK